MSAEYIGKTKGGIEIYELVNANGMRARIINYGVRIASLLVKDRKGDLVEVLAGFEDPDGFLGDNPYFNAVIGRVANRIGGAKFELNGKTYDLYKNDGNNHLHGGREGFDRKFWSAQIVDNALKLSYVSKDGEENYPATLNVTVEYELSDDDSLSIKYFANSDGDTLCSLTNHAYFNLDGDFQSVLDHEVYINSKFVTAIDKELIPTGELLDIRGTAYDFSEPKKIGRDIQTDDFMLNVANGYDFNYVLDNDGQGEVASAYSKKSGIKMSVYTDRDCMQLYTGNFLEGLEGRKTYGFRSAFCMETQGYPNACNVASFPSIVLKKGETYTAYTKYKFEIR